jgi:hypothetical protein
MKGFNNEPYQDGRNRKSKSENTSEKIAIEPQKGGRNREKGKGARRTENKE